MRAMTQGVAAMIALTLVASGCGGGSSDQANSGTDSSALENAGDCTAVDVATSPEKLDLLGSLAKSFNAKQVKVGGKCVFVRVQKKSSGAAQQALAKGWTAAEGPEPVIWSPASSAWGAVLNQRLADTGQKAMAPTDAKPFMLTPLVIAMPKPMADALGYPQKPVGFADIVRLARDPQGWAAYGHPEWGPFRLGKTNPNFSTSGLSALIAQTYAAAGKTTDLTLEDLNNPAVVETSKAIESAVVHYGDTTLTFLNNWFRADRRGTALTYASAVAVEEKSLLDYNSGNPDGILDPGEEPRAPKIPLVAVYPTEGTLFSDSPFFILDAPWVTAAQRQGATAFQEFVQQSSNQSTVLMFGFRPANPDVAIGAPIVAANGVDPSQPKTLLEVPQPKVMTALLDQWAKNRKPARVLLVMDVSGSMGDPADGSNSGETKLDLAKTAAINSLDQFADADQVGLRIFSTQLGPTQSDTFVDLQPVAPIGANREALKRSIDALTPNAGTPLYDVAQQSFQTMSDGYDPAAINAVILLTDGRNEDGDDTDDRKQLTALVASLRRSSSGELSKPVRMFTIGYGADADMAALTAIAEASNAASYNATDAASIAKVFTQVVSNF